VPLIRGEIEPEEDSAGDDTPEDGCSTEEKKMSAMAVAIQLARASKKRRPGMVGDMKRSAATAATHAGSGMPPSIDMSSSAKGAASPRRGGGAK
jgi:hypothetical protein